MFPLPGPVPAISVRAAAQAGVTVVLRCQECGHARATPASRLMAAYGDIDINQMRHRLRCTQCGHRRGQAIPVRPWRP